MAGTRRVKKRYTRRNYKRKQRGGNKHIVFYSCFYGKSGSAADVLPPLPSKKYDCYFFTNNTSMRDRANDAGWKVVFSDNKPKETNRDNAMDSKEVKACPHHFEELKGYTYSCYFDSKLKVYDTDIEKMLDGLKGNVVMLLNKHAFIEKSVRDELIMAMGIQKYAVNHDKYTRLIDSKLKAGLKDKAEVHYETGLILRLSGDIVNNIGEQWYKYIKETGAECQISFFFIQQEFKDNIAPLPKRYGQ